MNTKYMLCFKRTSSRRFTSTNRPLKRKKPLLWPNKCLLKGQTIPQFHKHTDIHPVKGRAYFLWLKTAQAPIIRAKTIKAAPSLSSSSATTYYFFFFFFSAIKGNLKYKCLNK